MFRIFRLPFRWGGGAGVAPQALTGIKGGVVHVVGGRAGAIIANDGRPLRLFINGIDRTDILQIGVTRRLALSGGSRATCQFGLIQQGNPFRPSQGDEVAIWWNGQLWFAGVVDSA